MGYAYFTTGRYSFIGDGVNSFLRKNRRLFRRTSKSKGVMDNQKSRSQMPFQIADPFCARFGTAAVLMAGLSQNAVTQVGNAQGIAVTAALVSTMGVTQLFFVVAVVIVLAAMLMWFAFRSPGD